MASREKFNPSPEARAFAAKLISFIDSCATRRIEWRGDIVNTKTGEVIGTVDEKIAAAIDKYVAERLAAPVAARDERGKA